MPALWPSELKARARARLLEHKSDEVYFPHVIRLMGLQATLDDPLAIAARATASQCCLKMEQPLRGQEYLAGPYSFADDAFYMAQLFGERMGAPLLEATPVPLEWRARMSLRGAIRQVVKPMAVYLLSQDRTLPTLLAAFVPIE